MWQNIEVFTYCNNLLGIPKWPLHYLVTYYLCDTTETQIGLNYEFVLILKEVKFELFGFCTKLDQFWVSVVALVATYCRSDQITTVRATLKVLGQSIQDQGILLSGIVNWSAAPWSMSFGKKFIKNNAIWNHFVSW